MFNRSAQYTANTGTALLTTNNPNLDGTGTLEHLFDAADYGGYIKTIRIKALADTTEGMIRLFVFDGSDYYLVKEFEVPPTKYSDTYPTFNRTYVLNYNLMDRHSLYVSTEQRERFIVVVDGLIWKY